MEDNKSRYDNLDGLRTYASIGILLMHVLTNGKYDLGNYMIEKIIIMFSNFVYLFMVISGFAMCCGYLEKMKKQQISLEEFYVKRYKKIFPFFAVIVCLDIIVSPSLNSLYEAFTSLTLCFGLLPNAKHTVIGTSWTLGVIFVFYLLFPFFVFLLGNKKRAWFTLGISLLYNYVCTNYYFDTQHMLKDYAGKTSFVFCAVYFVSGCMLYLYRKEISNSKSWIWLILSIIMVFVFCYRAPVLVKVGIWVAFVGYAISKKGKGIVLNNSCTKFISEISLEIYLCHMFIYRFLEKMGMVHMFENAWVSYIMTSVLTLAGAIVFSIVVRWGIDVLGKKLYYFRT